MTNTTHTPGLWQHLLMGNCSDKSAPWVVMKYNPETTKGALDASYSELPNKGEEGKANARLIAAAPDLLEALKEAYDMLSLYCDIPDIHTGDYMDTLETCRAAIAKARGRS